MEETRALLDALMGPNRNAAKPAGASDDPASMPEWDNKTVCKNFLVGFCCHDWFTLTKRQLPACNKIHSEVMREQFEAHGSAEAFRAEYEEDFLVYLETAARDCDAFIARERLKCRAASGKVVKMPPDVREKHDQMEAKYKDLIEKAEVLADESVTRSQEKMKQAMEVKEELDSLKAKYTTEFAGEDICEVCGVRYPLGDGAHDKESHKRGKTHGGFAQIRSKITELKAKRRSWDKLRDRIRENVEKRRAIEEEERKTQKALEKEKEKEREQQREKERELQKAEEAARRQRSRERKERREKAKSRSRDGRKEKPKDRGRKERSRSKKGRRGSDSEKEKGKSARRKPRSRSRRQKARSRSSSAGAAAAALPEDPATLWARLQSLPPARKQETIAALDPEIMDKLEDWLVSRIAQKKQNGPSG